MSKPVMVEISARHIHVSKEHLAILFGEGHELTEVKPLSQPGQYACAERLTVVGAKNSLSNVCILGPVRPETQVEISLTDARTIGVAVPIRESGDVAGSGSCKLIGPCGEVELAEGVIAAKRHIHMTPADAAELGVSDKQTVGVLIESDHRSLIFNDVTVRVSSSYAGAMHIDTDEANAAAVGPGATGIIIK